ncbi:MAG: ATP-dependent helicase [Rubrivivax sp.]|nr:ATP-dependent helicase [Rubrivivax sp.]
MSSTLSSAPPAHGFSQLNPEQWAAVAHGDGPLLLVAGAGTGKTGTLAARVARLVGDGADPQRLLLLTFSRRAAHELSHRCGLLLQQVLGLPVSTRPPALPWAGTFHAIAARLLREWAQPLGLAPGFTVLDRGDAEDLMAHTRAGLGQAEWPQRFPMAPTCLAIHSQRVNRDRPLPEVLAAAFPWCAPWAAELQQLFDAYADAKQRQHLLDLDDLLLYWATAMEEPAVAQALAARFDHVLVDEYQDTNRLQAHILQRLKPDGCGLTVVGDDDQSIYSFRAAEPGNLLDFAQQHGGTTRVLSLTQNYRATPALLAASNALMDEVPERHPKRLWSAAADGPRPRVVTVADEAAQARWVADEVLRQREEGLRLKRQAVLFRTGSHSTLLELELARRQIPFVKYGGLKFMAATHVKDLLAVLRWAHNPANTLAAQRCALLVAGLGPGSARRLVQALQGAAEPAAVLQAFVPPPSARAEWPALRTLWLALHQGALPWPAAFDAALAWYTPQLQRLHDDAAVRLADLQQLRQVAHAQPSGERFLAELSIDPPQASSDESGAPHRDEDYLVLSTMHSAKGQEWSAVHVLNLVDGCMPADLATGDAAQIDEERRLLYVAMTRARRQLNLLAPQRFHVSQQARWGDRHLYASLSRFLTPAVLACCEQVAGPGPAEAALGADLPSGLLDLAARVRARGC